VESEKQSIPVKPVVKTEQIGQSGDQVGLKSGLSGVDSESIGQPPVKRQKVSEWKKSLIKVFI